MSLVSDDLRRQIGQTLAPERRTQDAAFQPPLTSSYPSALVPKVLYLYSSPSIAASHCMFAGELQYPLFILLLHSAVA
jgi:hypothetical protein